MASVASVSGIASARPAIGIDLGTNNCCISVFKNEQPEVIPDEHGNRIIPTCMVFTKKGLLLGDKAKADKIVSHVENSLFDVKRLIGRRFDEPSIQADMKFWAFEVVDDLDMPRLMIDYKQGRKLLHPEQVYSIFLDKLKEIGETYLDDSITEAILTVPSQFNYAQRQAVKDAATISGIKALRVISETTAAGMAFGFGKLDSLSRLTEPKNVLILDIGGGATSVSVFSYGKDGFIEKSIAGDNHMGGLDLNNRLAKHFIQEIKQKHDVDITLDDKEAVCRLKIACEAAKIALSTEEEVFINITDLVEDVVFSTSITRKEFEELNAHQFETTWNLVATALEDAQLKTSDINEIILIGGSTLVPKIEQMIIDNFEGMEPNKSVNRSEAVATGAAILAAMMSQPKPKEIEDLFLMEVTPFNIGIAVDTKNGTEMITVVKRSTTYPTRQTPVFKKSELGGEIRVYQGDRISENNYLGKLPIDSISSVTAEGDVEVTFDIDICGVLKVWGVEAGTGVQCTPTFSTADMSRFSKADMDKMIKEAASFKTWGADAYATQDIED